MEVNIANCEFNLVMFVNARNQHRGGKILVAHKIMPEQNKISLKTSGKTNSGEYFSIIPKYHFSAN